MLIIEPRGGLGNRMRSLDGARALAAELGRPLAVMWGMEFGAAFTDLFEPLSGIAAWYEFNRETAAGREARRRILAELRPDLSLSAEQTESLFVKKFSFAFSGLREYRRIHIESWMRIHQGPKPFAEFVLREDLRARVAAATGMFGKTVGVHIRRTDSVKSIGHSPTDAFMERMKELLDAGEADNIFLASDDPREDEAVVARFPGKIIHLPKRSLDRRERAAAEDAVVDLYCLAATSRLLGSYSSSFSMTAAAINDIPLEMIDRPPPQTPRDTVITFGIPLLTTSDPIERRFRARMLSATLASIYAQTDGAFRVILCGSYMPEIDIPVDDRLEFVRVAARPQKTLAAGRSDAGRKAARIAARHAELGGGYLMYVDMDDLVSRRLVAFVRANPHPNGYVIEEGFAWNARLNKCLPVAGFNKKCGTSAILNVTPSDIGGPDSRLSTLRREGHYMVVENAAAEGRPLMTVPFEGAVWVIDHGGNIGRQDKGGQAERTMLARAMADNGLPGSQLAFEFAAPEHYPLIDDYVESDGRPAPPSLSVAVITYRRPEGLRRLLTALVPQKEASGREIVVVNDGSHDDAYEAVRAEFADHIKYRALPENVGVAKARNASAELAEGDYLVFTDDDCVPPPWWLDWLQARLQWATDLDVVAGPTLPLPPARSTFMSRVQSCHDVLPRPSRSTAGTLFVTANVAIRRSLFWKVGGFGFPGPFHGAGEDTELSARLSQAGASTCIDPSWHVQHEANAGFLALCRRYWRYGYANGTMLSLTTSPQVHDGLVWYRRRRHLRNWVTEYREQRVYAAQVSRRRVVQVLSAFVASLIRMAYYDGCAAALRDRDRRRFGYAG